MFRMKESPTKHPDCQCTPGVQGDPTAVLIPKAGTITSFFTSFSLMSGMFSCCKETRKVSPEERQVERLSFNFPVLLVSSQLCTLKSEISHWHLLHFLLCLKHLVSFRDKCNAHASKLKENTVVNAMLSIRNSSSVHLPKVRLPSSIQLLFLPLYLHRELSLSKAEPVSRICEQRGLMRKIWVFLGVNKQLIGRKGGEMNPRLS